MTIPLATPANLRKAMAHLAENDPQLAPVIERAGMPTIRPHSNHYEALISSILSQQLSVKAAEAIERRFLELFGGALPTPVQILTKDEETLRGIGISYAKARYMLDLAAHINDGRLSFDKIKKMPNDEVIAMLTDVKGIGEWTAHMYLMFCVGRLDVLPVGDLGIKNGVKKLYRLRDQPDAAKLREVARKKKWAPYESVASWYIWHSLDNKPAI